MIRKVDNIILFWFKDDSKQETKENEMIQEALSILFLQAAKRGLSIEELMFEWLDYIRVRAYTKQLDWPSEQVSIVSDVYESKYLQMRKSLDSSSMSYFPFYIQNHRYRP